MNFDEVVRKGLHVPGQTGSLLASFGPFWKWGSCWHVEVMSRCVCVVRLDRSSLMGFHTEWFGLPEGTESILKGGTHMASKWISAAVTKKAKATKVRTAEDPMLWKGRPALADFMTELESGPGVPREPSVLMICASVGGLRVGLKDDDAGGWLWREAATLEEGLDAIEKALQSGAAVWSTPGGKRGKKA